MSYDLLVYWFRPPAAIVARRACKHIHKYKIYITALRSSATSSNNFSNVCGAVFHWKIVLILSSQKPHLSGISLLGPESQHPRTEKMCCLTIQSFIVSCIRTSMSFFYWISIVNKQNIWIDIERSSAHLIYCSLVDRKKQDSIFKLYNFGYVMNGWFGVFQDKHVGKGLSKILLKYNFK